MSALCGFREWKPSQRRPEGSNLVCTQSKSVQDIEGDFLDFKRPARQVPGSFDLTQPLVEVLGLCQHCRATTERQPPASATGGDGAKG